MFSKLSESELHYRSTYRFIDYVYPASYAFGMNAIHHLILKAIKMISH